MGPVSSLWLRLHRVHLSAQPRTGSRVSAAKQQALSPGGERPRQEKSSGRKGAGNKKELSKLEGRTFRGTKGKRFVKWRKKWGAEVKRKKGPGPAGGNGGPGSASRPGRRRGGPRRAWAARRPPVSEPAGALSAAPGAGEERRKEQFEGPTRQGQRAHPQPSPAT